MIKIAFTKIRRNLLGAHMPVAAICFAFLAGFGCGEEESLPPDIVDVNELPCPSCERDEQPTNATNAAAQQSDNGSTGTTPSNQPITPATAEMESANEVDPTTDANTTVEEPSVEIADPSPPASIPVTYDFSDEESLLFVQVFKDESRFLAGFSHNHVIRATAWSTNFTYDASDPSNCSIEARVPVEELRVDETAMRALVQQGYLGANGQPVPGSPDYTQRITDGDRSQIRTSMLSVSQLNSVVYPEITLSGNDCTGMVGQSGETLVPATMVVRGVRSAVSMQLTYDFTNPDETRIRGVIDTTHAQLGFEPYADLGGTVGNAQPLKFTLDLLGRAR